MKSQVSQPESWKRVFDIEVPHEELTALYEKKMGSVKKDISLPGFRPGKVPPALIKQRYGDAIRAEVIDDLVQKSFKEACTEKNIVPISVGKVEKISAEEGKPLTFTIETEVDPEIEIKGYEKRKIKVSPKKIKEDDVDEAVKNLLDRFAEFSDVDRPTKKGDYARLEYIKVLIDGELRTDVKNPSYPVELGSEHRIKDFDKGLIGHAAGETVEITIKFPKDYAEQDVAGKSGEFTIKIVGVQEKKLPDLASILPKLGGGIENEEGLRDTLKKRLEAEDLEKTKNEAYGKAIEQLIKDNQFEVPNSRIEHFIDYVIEEAKKEQRQGESLPTREEVNAKYRDIAINTIKRQRIIEVVATKEKILATQEEVDGEIQKLADMYQQPFETLKKTLRQNGTTLRIREDIKERKTLDFLVGIVENSSQKQ